jgi:putative transposase
LKKSLDQAGLNLDQKREMMLLLNAHYPMNLLGAVLGVPHSSAYYHARPSEDRPVRDALLELAGEWPTYGYRRLTVMLKRQGHAVNTKRVRRLMHELGIAGEAPRRTPRTTDSNHAYPRFPNLVEGLEVTRPDQVWVADITYIKLRKEFVYLAVIMDVFTRCIRGWHLGRSLEQELTLTALGRAYERGRPEIHHSDQGVQYAATAYVDMLMSEDIQISMASVGEPEENGYAERLMRTIKEEEVDLSDYEDFADALRGLGRFLDDVYDRKRIHSSLGYLTPAEFEQQWMAKQQAC